MSIIRLTPRYRTSAFQPHPALEAVQHRLLSEGSAFRSIGISGSGPAPPRSRRWQADGKRAESTSERFSATAPRPGTYSSNQVLLGTLSHYDGNSIDIVGKMWVFGYGSLMWDGWEATRGCVRRARAELVGYRRAFNKASVRNWGTQECPGPTLNLIKLDSACCHGMAFKFPDDHEQEILAYLTNREGRDFVMRKLPARLTARVEIIAIVPVYEGKNLIEDDRIEHIANLVRQASGRDGACISYVKGVAEALCRLGINDSAVSNLWDTLVQSDTNPRAL